MENKSVKCGKLNISNSNPFTLIAGPCQLENEKHAINVATELFEIDEFIITGVSKMIKQPRPFFVIEKGFTGDGKPPKLTDELRIEAAARYMEVVENFTAEPMQLEVGPVDESIYSILNPFAY